MAPMISARCQAPCHVLDLLVSDASLAIVDAALAAAYSTDSLEGDDEVDMSVLHKQVTELQASAMYTPGNSPTQQRDQ